VPPDFPRNYEIESLGIATATERRLRAGFEEAENVADRDLGPVDVTEHKRDPSGSAVYIDHVRQPDHKIYRRAVVVR
jgi:hypothetical protein